MTSLLINLYAKRNFTAVNHSDVTRQAVLSPTAIIQVKMLTRGGVAVELRREKSFPRVGTCTEHRVGLRWAKNPSPPALVGL